MKKPLLILSLAAMALTGCVSRIDATSQDTVQKSVAALAEHAPKDIHAAVAAASQRYLDVYFGKAEKPATAPEWFVVDHMGPQEFVRFVQHFLAPPIAATPPAAPVPDRFITAQYLASLHIAKDLYDKARDKAHVSGNYTVDQFDWQTPTLVPPDPKENLGPNPVTFNIQFTNHTGFDVFHPAYRVVIKLPDLDYASFDEVLTAAADTPIPPEKEETVTLTCCTMQDNPTMNRILRDPPKGTVFEYALVGIGDYGKRQALDNTIFPQTSFDNLKRIDACLADVEQQGDKWTPATAAPVCREHDELMKAKRGNESIHHHNLT